MRLLMNTIGALLAKRMLSSFLAIASVLVVSQPASALEPGDILWYGRARDIITRSTVAVIAANGEPKSAYTSVHHHTSAIAPSSDGRILFASGKNIYTPDLEGSEFPVIVAELTTTLREFIVAPSGNLFVTNYSIIYEVDPETGYSEVIAFPFPGVRQIRALGNAPGDELFIGDLNQILRWNFEDPISQIARIPSATSLIDMVVESETTLVVLLRDSVVRVDVATGQIEMINNEPIYGAARNIEIDSNGKIVVSAYNLSPFGTPWGGLFTIEPHSGEASLLASGYPLGSGTGLAVVPGASAIGIEVDVKPDGTPNSINPLEEGVIPVAILGSETFDVLTLDESTLRFGTFEASPVHDLMDPTDFSGHLEDVNGDEIPDLVTHFRTGETGIEFGEIIACLSGTTRGGSPFRGCDSIRTVPDRDGDGLLDIDEVAIGTNALSADSDWDGFSDAEEVRVLLSDPLDYLDPDPGNIVRPKNRRKRRR
jgi:hypothetical protein